PQKLAMGFALTRELAEGSNSEVFVTRALSENLTLGVDTLLLDTTAGSTTRPAGLRFNVSGLTPTSGGGLPALVGALAQLAAAVDGIGGSNIVFITGVKDWVKIKTYAPNFSLPVLVSGAVADGTIICLAVDALAVCGSSVPIRIERSIEAVIHLEDTS